MLRIEALDQRAVEQIQLIRASWQLHNAPGSCRSTIGSAIAND
jgi:hypothetical protein